MGGEEKLEEDVGGEVRGLASGYGGSAQGEVWLESSAPVMGDRGDEW